MLTAEAECDGGVTPRQRGDIRCGVMLQLVDDVARFFLFFFVDARTERIA